MSTSEKRRNELRSDPNCRFVSWSEFSKILVSRSFFERSDDVEAAVFGLTNLSNGYRFLIESEKVPKHPTRHLGWCDFVVFQVATAFAFPCILRKSHSAPHSRCTIRKDRIAGLWLAWKTTSKKQSFPQVCLSNTRISYWQSMLFSSTRFQNQQAVFDMPNDPILIHLVRIHFAVTRWRN